MRFELFIEEVQTRTGLTERSEAMAVIEATVGVLGQLLAENERRQLSAHLPDELAYALQEDEAGQDFELDEFYERVSEREGVEEGFGLEHAQTVCKVFNQMLDNEDRVFIRQRLPESVASLFEEPSENGVMPLDEQLRMGPGVESEFSSFEDRERQRGQHNPDALARQAGQSNSVVTDENPHGESKLSSGRPHTGSGDLSSGRSGSDRSLSDYGLD
jgi:uncharacterized protein (DUF2267 family)